MPADTLAIDGGHGLIGIDDILVDRRHSDDYDRHKNQEAKGRIGYAPLRAFLLLLGHMAPVAKDDGLAVGALVYDRAGPLIGLVPLLRSVGLIGPCRRLWLRL